MDAFRGSLSPENNHSLYIPCALWLLISQEGQILIARFFGRLLKSLQLSESRCDSVSLRSRRANHGRDERSRSPFSHGDLEKRIGSDHPLQAIRQEMNTARRASNNAKRSRALVSTARITLRVARHFSKSASPNFRAVERLAEREIPLSTPHARAGRPVGGKSQERQ
jgi:hypothetical protein